MQRVLLSSLRWCLDHAKSARATIPDVDGDSGQHGRKMMISSLQRSSGDAVLAPVEQKRSQCASGKFAKMINPDLFSSGTDNLSQRFFISGSFLAFSVSAAEGSDLPILNPVDQPIITRFCLDKRRSLSRWGRM